MTAPARIPEDARYADEEAFKSLVVSLLDRIATALEEANAAPEVSVGEAPFGDPSTFVPIGDAYRGAPASVVVPAVLAQAQTYQQFPAPAAGWACPEHHQVKTVPAGISKAGKSYPEFLACPTSRCDHVARRCRVAGCTDASRA